MDNSKTSAKCPYSINILSSTAAVSAYVIREKDNYGEYPNIYVYVYHRNEARDPVAIVLSDTGTGLNVANETTTGHRRPSNIDQSTDSDEPAFWNIATFLAYTLNPSHRVPYVVLITHAHYDHILGLRSLKDAGADLTIYASSHDKEYLVPWSNLQKHSLADAVGEKVPKYDAHWIDDASPLHYIDQLSGSRKETGLTIIHTCGHTPDSLSWYDRTSCVLSVGDMIYEKESSWTKSGSDGQWAREPPQPIMFNQASNVVDWNASLHRLLDFVRSENRRLGTDEEKLIAYWHSVRNRR